MPGSGLTRDEEEEVTVEPRTEGDVTPVPPPEEPPAPAPHPERGLEVDPVAQPA